MKAHEATVLATILLACLGLAVPYSARAQTTIKSNKPAEGKVQELINAWCDVDKQSVPALEAFLAKYRDSKAQHLDDADLTKYKDSKAQHLDDAELFLSLAKKVQEIKSGKTKPSFVIPFDKLPEKWTKWKKEYPYGGALSFRHTGRSEAVSLPRGCRVRMDNVGSPTLPTDDGSILMFKTEVANAKWSDVADVFLGGYLIEAKGKDPIYFAVIQSLGIAHLQGACSVTAPDKTTKILK